MHNATRAATNEGHARTAQESDYLPTSTLKRTLVDNADDTSVYHELMICTVCLDLPESTVNQVAAPLPLPRTQPVHLPTTQNTNHPTQPHNHTFTSTRATYHHPSSSRSASMGTSSAQRVSSPTWKATEGRRLASAPRAVRRMAANLSATCWQRHSSATASGSARAATSP